MMSPDPAITDALNHWLSWRPPAIIQEFGDVRASDATSRLRASVLPQIAQMEAAVAKWIEAGTRVKESLWAVFREGPVRPDHIEMLNSMLATMEERQQQDSRAYKRQRKKFLQQMREANAVPPGAAAAVQEVAKRTLAVMAQEMAAVTEFTLFLRALRAEHSAQARGGPVFDDPEELKRRLRSAIR